MKCTENLAQNSTHLYAICGTNFIQRYTSFLKIYRMLSGKMIPTVIKNVQEKGLLNCTHCYKNIQNMEVFHQESYPQ